MRTTTASLLLVSTVTSFVLAQPFSLPDFHALKPRLPWSWVVSNDEVSAVADVREVGSKGYAIPGSPIALARSPETVATAELSADKQALLEEEARSDHDHIDDERKPVPKPKLASKWQAKPETKPEPKVEMKARSRSVKRHEGKMVQVGRLKAFVENFYRENGMPHRADRVAGADMAGRKRKLGRRGV